MVAFRKLLNGSGAFAIFQKIKEKSSAEAVALHQINLLCDN